MLVGGLSVLTHVGRDESSELWQSCVQISMPAQAEDVRLDSMGMEVLIWMHQLCRAALQWSCLTWPGSCLLSLPQYGTQCCGLCRSNVQCIAV